MLTKLSISSLLMVITVSAQAMTELKKTDYFSNGYLGAGIFFQSNYETYSGPLVQRLTDISIQDIHGGNNSWGGNLALGYGKVYNQTYLGAELFTRTTEGKQNLITGFKPSRYVAMKTPFTYGAIARVGYLFNPQILAYVGLGMENTHFKLLTNRNGMVVTTLADDTQAGIVSSIGIDYALNDHWQVGTRFSYTNYRTVDFDNTGDIDDSGSFNARHAIFGVNLVYRFSEV